LLIHEVILHGMIGAWCGVL